MCRPHAVQILAENEKLSSAAQARSDMLQPQLAFHPPDGPMAAISLPEVAAEQRIAAKYHVVLTADASVYAEWPSLVRCCGAASSTAIIAAMLLGMSSCTEQASALCYLSIVHAWHLLPLLISLLDVPCQIAHGA